MTISFTAACVSVAVAGEKVTCGLLVRNIAQSSRQETPISQVGEWQAVEDSHKDVIFFETLGSASGPVKVTNGESDIEDLDTFESQDPEWREYGYKKMLALMHSLPPSVYQDALKIRYGRAFDRRQRICSQYLISRFTTSIVL